MSLMAVRTLIIYSVLLIPNCALVTPRRWLDQVSSVARIMVLRAICCDTRIQCNPGLSQLISETLKLPKATFLKDLYKLEVSESVVRRFPRAHGYLPQGLLEYVDDPKFQKKWAAIKQSNKERLAHHIEITLGLRINTHAMFDVQIKVCRLTSMRTLC